LQTLYIAQQLYGSVHFLSLEIDNNTNKLYKKIDTRKIKSVFVQSPMRFDYLFPDTKLKTFIVQNAPVFAGVPTEQKAREGFIWAGAIDRRLAILDCLQFFDRYPIYKLEMKGGGDQKTKRIIEEKYKHLLENKTVVFNQEYLPDNSFIDFLSKFRIGFCFYSWQLIHSSFNYLTAPSGKLFMYFAAGTPVIACNIPGFSFVKEFGAGILIDDYKPETILNAITTIEENYQQYSDACYEVARHYSFAEHVKPYVDFLIKEG
jgi:glycosyltransferase involved in cell wall biosynthesis